MIPNSDYGGKGEQEEKGDPDTRFSHSRQYRQPNTRKRYLNHVLDENSFPVSLPAINQGSRDHHQAITRWPKPLSGPCVLLHTTSISYHEKASCFRKIGKWPTSSIIINMMFFEGHDPKQSDAES